MNSARQVLYLSYDGMTDPLGMSQVIPYLRGLSSRGYDITLLSCEKPARQRSGGDAIARLLAESRIDWRPIAYHKRPPVLSTVWDLKAMGREAARIVREKGVRLVHCRSYVPSLVGLRLKRELGTRFVFDMRGFWADERVDGGLWDQRNPLYRSAYRYFKKQERAFLTESDRAVSLTHAGKQEMLSWGLDAGLASRVDVIPCCADLEHFDRARVSPEEIARLRAELKLTASDFVVSYLGSLGTWYLLEEMLAYFRALKAARPHAKLLFITPDEPEMVREAARQAGVSEGDVRVRSAGRAEVPGLLALSQMGLFFIKPSYSKISSSPTKLAEILAMGIPVVTNAGVGDMDWLAGRTPAVHAMRDFSPGEVGRAVAAVSGLTALDPKSVRAVALDHFSLERGVEAYSKIYSTLF